jgi:hypothetical protein
MPYDPLADYIRQRGSKHPEPNAEEAALLRMMSREEVNALVSIDNRARALKCADQDFVVYIIGAHSY